MKGEIRKMWDSLNQLLVGVENLMQSDEHQAMKSKGESWSAFETLVHLYLTEMWALKYIKYKESKVSTPPKKSRLHGFRNWLLKKYMRSSRKRSSPELVDPREYKGRDIPDIKSLLSRYKDVREELAGILDSKDEKWLSSGIFKHPVIGRIDALGMLGFFDEHFKRHVDQIERAMH